MSKEERAQARADKAARKAARPWPLRHWMLTGIGVIVVIVIVASVASSGGGSTPNVTAGNTVSSSPTASPASETAGKVFQHPEDVKITSCGVDDAGFADAKLTITNTSSKASDYVVTVAFESPDGSKQVGTGTALVNSLQPGQSSDQDANSLSSAAAGSFVCKISSAQRNAAY